MARANRSPTFDRSGAPFSGLAKPCRREFRAERDLPCAVRGPVLKAAFCRLASTLALDVISGSFPRVHLLLQVRAHLRRPQDRLGPVLLELIVFGLIHGAVLRRILLVLRQFTWW